MRLPFLAGCARGLRTGMLRGASFRRATGRDLFRPQRRRHAVEDAVDVLWPSVPPKRLASSIASLIDTR